MFGVQDTRGGNLRGRFKRVIIIVPVDPTNPWLVVQRGFNKLTFGMVTANYSFIGCVLNTGH